MINCISYRDFEPLLSGEYADYYRGRWEYFKEVIGLAQDVSAARVLEIGPGILPIVKDADILLNPEDDQFGKPKQSIGKVIVHDLTVKPWPIFDKYYDLVIALQVWEHLDNKQSRAFRELMRTSRKAILSFPYQWEGGIEKHSHRLHRDIDRELIIDWALNIQPMKQLIVQRTGPEFSKGPRFIGYWEFEE